MADFAREGKGIMRPVAGVADPMPATQPANEPHIHATVLNPGQQMMIGVLLDALADGGR